MTDSPARGTTPAAAQQFSLLMQTQGTICSPRKAFRRDLQEYILSCRAKGNNAYFEGPFPTSLRVCTQLLKQAKKNELTSIVIQSYQQREQEHKQQIKLFSSSMEQSDMEEGIRLRHLQKAEITNQLVTKLRSLQQLQEKTGVSQIEVPSPGEADPKECNTWVQLDIPDKVAKHLLTRNRKKFGQAAGTPFTVHSLSTHLGFDGQGEAAGEDPNVVALMKYIQQIARAQTMTLQPTITEKASTAKLKVWRESTATSPSGLHRGHYKAIVKGLVYSIVG